MNVMRTLNSLVLATALIGVGSVPAQQPAARAWADSSTFFVGDPITVHVEITHPPTLGFSPLIGDTIGVFHVLSRAPMHSSSGTTTTSVTVAAYDSGTAIVPPLAFSYTADTAQHVVSTNPLILTIRLVPVDTTKEFKDIKPPLAIALTVAEVSLIIGVGVGAVLLLYGFMQYRKRKKERHSEDLYAPPPKPAHVEAFERLAFLKEKRLWQQGLIKPYYTEVSEIVRRYFEQRFGFAALEQTTDETLHDLRRFAVAHPVFSHTETLLRRADLVKFAKYQPSVSENEEMMTLAFEIVDKTKVVDLPPVGDPQVPQQEVSEVVHA
ncbi:MAG: hypothetical protein C4326_05375 [Ignavibacteria bacterium]